MRVKRMQPQSRRQVDAEIPDIRHKRNIDDGDLAKVLGYPERKRDVAAAMLRGDQVIAHQALDRAGNVVAEGLSSGDRSRKTAEAIGRQVPVDGRLVSTSLADVHGRRLHERAREASGEIGRRARGGAMTPDEAAFARMSAPEMRAYHEAQRRATEKGLPGGIGGSAGVSPSAARGGRLPQRRD